MTKPTYTSIIQHAKGGKPALVFMPTRKHARLNVIGLLTYSNVDGGERSQFLQFTEEDLKPFIAKVKEPTLIHALSNGIGYLHEGLTLVEQ